MTRNANESESASSASQAGVALAPGDERLGQPLAGVGLAPDSGGAQLVDGKPRDHGRDVRPRRLDALTRLERAVQAQEALLHDVLPPRSRRGASGKGIANAGGRSSSNRSVLAMAQPSPFAKPSRQLG
jgi:hypothetical protein